MTNLIDGPAHGKRLMLRRCARFLRVVINSKGEIDALDQPTDTPAKDETIYAYEITEKPGHMHIRCGGKSKGASGFYPIADYRYIPEQPSQIIMERAWDTWTAERAKANPRPELE